MIMNESLREKYNTSYQKSLLEKWDKNIKAVKKVYPKFSDISAVNLAIVCENTEAQINKYRKINEGTQTPDVGAYVRHAYELITGVMPNLVAEEVVSVQALNQKLGQIFFLEYVYGSGKGTTARGKIAMDPYSINTDLDYTSENIPEEVITLSGTTGAVTGTLSWGPVIPGTIHITNTAGTVDITDTITPQGSTLPNFPDYDATGKPVDTNAPATYKQNAPVGTFTGTGISAGTINYTTGAITLTLTASLSDVTDCSAEYSYSLEYAPTQAPQFDMHIREKIVVAKPRRLRTNYAFEAAYDVEKQFGINMDDELLLASVTEIKHEIDQEILNDLKRQAALSYSWDATKPNGISLQQHYESFGIAVNEAANLIRKATRRVKGNFVICGINALNAIESIPAFIPGNATDKAGAYVAGTLKNQIKVIANPFYGENDWVVGYKGDNFLEAGYVYAPYLPVFATSVIMLDDFVGRRGYATSYAKAMLAPNYYVKGTITHSDAVVPVFVTNDNDHPVYTTQAT